MFAQEPGDTRRKRPPRVSPSSLSSYPIPEELGWAAPDEIDVSSVTPMMFVAIREIHMGPAPLESIPMIPMVIPMVAHSSGVTNYSYGGLWVFTGSY